MPCYRFVEGSNSRYGHSDQSHAQRESARMRQWERRKDLIGSMSIAGGLPWTRRSTYSPAKETQGANEGEPMVGGHPHGARSKAAQTQMGAARRNPVIDRSLSGSGNSIPRLKPYCIEPFGTPIVPIQGKSLDALLDFRKFQRSACNDRFRMTY